MKEENKKEKISKSKKDKKDLIRNYPDTRKPPRRRKKSDGQFKAKDKIKICPQCKKKFTARDIEKRTGQAKYQQKFCSAECLTQYDKWAWRKSKLTPEVKKKLEEVYQLDCSMQEIAFWVDVSLATIYNWKKEEPELFEKLERLREKPVLIARKTIVNGISSDTNLAMKYLERKKRNEFSQKYEITWDMKTTVDYKVNPQVYEAMKERLWDTDLDKILPVSPM